MHKSISERTNNNDCFAAYLVFKIEAIGTGAIPKGSLLGNGEYPDSGRRHLLHGQKTDDSLTLQCKKATLQFSIKNGQLPDTMEGSWQVALPGTTVNGRVTLVRDHSFNPKYDYSAKTPNSNSKTPAASTSSNSDSKHK